MNRIVCKCVSYFALWLLKAQIGGNDFVVEEWRDEMKKEGGRRELNKG